VVVWSKRAPSRHRRAEQLEESLGHADRDDLPRLAPIAVDAVLDPYNENGGRHERCLLAQPGQFLRGHQANREPAVRHPGADGVDVSGVLVRQWPQEGRLNDGKERRRGRDADGEGADGCRKERRLPAQGTNRADQGIHGRAWPIVWA
jgi:hypothetical protein